MGRRPDGEQALTGAERQARYRQRPGKIPEPPPVQTMPRRLPRGPTLSRRWNDTVAGLVALQAEYARWLEALPEATRDTAPGELFRQWSIWTLKRSLPYSHRAASDAIKSRDVTNDHEVPTAPPFCAGPWPGTEQERSGQITSYINRTR
jgi:hypothetical protein